jgi:hypothetical protein
LEADQVRKPAGDIKRRASEQVLAGECGTIKLALGEDDGHRMSFLLALGSAAKQVILYGAIVRVKRARTAAAIH